MYEPQISRKERKDVRTAVSREVEHERIDSTQVLAA
jgi:hypothetical protein